MSRINGCDIVFRICVHHERILCWPAPKIASLFGLCAASSRLSLLMGEPKAHDPLSPDSRRECKAEASPGRVRHLEAPNRCGLIYVGCQGVDIQNEEDTRANT